MNELNIKLGTLLKTERETQKISIEDLSERLKISVSNLQSIEQGTTDGLPSDLYLSLFAKSYAEALGIDYTRTVEAIKVDVEEELNASVKSKKNDKNQNSDDPDGESKSFSTTSIIIATVVVISLLYFGADKFIFNSDSSDNANNTEATQEEVKSQETIKSDEAYANYDWDNKEYDKPSKIVLTMTPRAESWSAVFADGDTAIYRTLRVGRTYTAEADYRMTISVGKPLSVTVKLNGQEVDLRNKDSKRITKVKINQMNIHEYLQTENNSKTTETAKQVTNAVQAVASTNDSVSNENNETN